MRSPKAGSTSSLCRNSARVEICLARNGAPFSGIRVSWSHVKVAALPVRSAIWRVLSWNCSTIERFFFTVVSVSKLVTAGACQMGTV